MGAGYSTPADIWSTACMVKHVVAHVAFKNHVNVWVNTRTQKIKPPNNLNLPVTHDSIGV